MPSSSTVRSRGRSKPYVDHDPLEVHGSAPSLNIEAIVGGVIGGVALVFFLIFPLSRSRRKHKRNPTAEESEI